MSAEPGFHLRHIDRSPGSRGCDHLEARVAAPFGVLVVRTDGEALVGIDYLPRSAPLVAPRHPLLVEACRQVEAYLRDPHHCFDLPLDLGGTAHRQRVWRAISAIPVGSTRSYGELAAELGSSARAVGQACGANPLPLVIPCHRVVAKGGGLGGFMHAGDGFPLSVKRWLLVHERG